MSRASWASASALCVATAFCRMISCALGPFGIGTRYRKGAVVPPAGGGPAIASMVTSPFMGS